MQSRRTLRKPLPAIALAYAVAGRFAPLRLNFFKNKSKPQSAQGNIKRKVRKGKLIICSAYLFVLCVSVVKKLNCKEYDDGSE